MDCKKCKPSVPKKTCDAYRITTQQEHISELIKEVRELNDRLIRVESRVSSVYDRKEQKMYMTHNISNAFNDKIAAAKPLPNIDTIDYVFGSILIMIFLLAIVGIYHIAQYYLS